jgi:hypothetical protein
MNALFLKDLAEKTHRGLRGRIEDGKSAGGLCYGYRVVKTLNGGTVTTGEREIEPGEAAVVERMFREFIAGVSQSKSRRTSIARVCQVRSVVPGVRTRPTATPSVEPESSTTSSTSAAWSGIVFAT